MKLNVIFNITLVTLLLGLFVGCSDDEDSGNPTRMYVDINTDNSLSYLVNKIPDGVFGGDFTIEFPVKVTKPLSSDIVANVVFDNSLVAAYSAAYNADMLAENPNAEEVKFLEMPAGIFVVESGNIIIPANTYKSSDNFKLKFNDSDLLVKGKYLLPVQLSSSAQGCVVSSNRSIIYVVVDITSDLIVFDASSIEGTVLDRTLWNIEIETDSPTSYVGSPGALMDGKLSNFNGMYISAGSWFSITIDCGEQVEFMGAKIAPMHDNVSYRNHNYDYFAISDDKTNWNVFVDTKTDFRAYNQGYNYVKFYSSQSARYVKFIMARHGPAGYSGVSEVHLVSNN